MLDEELSDFITKNKQNLGLVSLEAPLISNLDVWVNIALIKQYHENLPKKTAKSLALQYLQRYRMEHIADKRNSALTHDERFIVMLLRAAMVKDSLIVLDRPFMIIPDIQDDRFIYDALQIISDSFKECHTFDYTWFKDRYGIFNAEKN
jgi:ABC-type lipopolysaccharide export system ATPase subunit